MRSLSDRDLAFYSHMRQDDSTKVEKAQSCFLVERADLANNLDDFDAPMYVSESNLPFEHFLRFRPLIG